jgi:hypothetical protein
MASQLELVISPVASLKLNTTYLPGLFVWPPKDRIAALASSNNASAPIYLVP